MTIQLKKGEGINLSKDHGLKKVIIEVTYDLDPTHNIKKHDFDVNVCGFEVSHDATGKAGCKQDECFVFYGNTRSATGAVTHDKDGGSIGDDKMTVDLDALDKNTLGVDEVSLFVEIYEGLKRQHRFGQLQHCTAHIINPDTQEVISEFKLSDEDGNYTAVQMGSLVKDSGNWHFKAIGAPFNKGLEDILEVYGLQAADEE